MTTEFRGGVQVRNLTWTPFASSKPLLNNITFSINAGERVLLVGPSGSGKSTLLRAIAGVLQDTESGGMAGSIETGSSGLLLQDPNDSIVAPTLLREVAFGPENAGLPREAILNLVESTLASVQIDKPLQASSTDLSGGEMQRVALAGVVALRPNLLLLDEPTSMLDSSSALAVRQTVIATLKASQQTLIVAEHRFDGWVADLDRILVLDHDGQLAFDGMPSQILAEHRNELLDLGVWIPGEPATAAKPIKLAEGEFTCGSITVFTGNSGAGKTTELNRLIRADRNSETILTGVGFVPQQPELTILGNTVFESANFTARLAAQGLGIDAEESEQHTRRLLDLAGLSALESQNPYEISGGEQRRLALATALAHNPMSVYLDEPTVGQDRSAWASVVGLIVAAREAGMNVFIASHDQDLIALADRVIKIQPEIAMFRPPAVSKVSGLAILAAPIILLIGSMGIVSTKAGLASVVAIAAAWLILTMAGLKFKAPKLLIAPVVGVLSIGLSNWYLSRGLQLETGLTAALRVASFVFPGVFLATALRPYRLGDQLAQTLKLPARPVIAAMVAMERIGFFTGMWSQLQFIHNIRGVTAHRSPLARIRSAFWMTFTLLVQAIRSAGTTAVAMDARCFSKSTGRRTWAEQANWRQLDLLLITLSAVVAAVPFLVR